MILLLNIIILAIIAFIVWWFWLYKPTGARVIDEGEVTINIENGVYQPSHIVSHVGQELKINFMLKDDSHCAKKVIFSDFDKSLDLEKNTPSSVIITPNEIGEYVFSCPMVMYKGILEVKPAPGIDIVLDGGVFVPNLIHADADKPLVLNFIRKDPSRCAQTIMFPELEQFVELPFDQVKSVIVHPKKTGEYHFSCEMGMYQGSISVE